MAQERRQITFDEWKSLEAVRKMRERLSKVVKVDFDEVAKGMSMEKEVDDFLDDLYGEEDVGKFSGMIEATNAAMRRAEDAKNAKEPHSSATFGGVMHYRNDSTGSGWHPMTPGKSYNYPLGSSPSRVYAGHKQGIPEWKKPEQVKPKKEDPYMDPDPYWEPHGPPSGFYPPKR